MGWASGTLRVASETMSPADITMRLGVEPTRTFEKGSLASERNPASMRRDRALWLRESGLSRDARLEEHVESLLRVLEEHGDGFSSIQLQCTFDLFLGYSSDKEQGGIVFDKDVLARIARAGLDLVLDIYCHEVQDSV